MTEKLATISLILALLCSVCGLIFNSEILILLAGYSFLLFSILLLLIATIFTSK